MAGTHGSAPHACVAMPKTGQRVGENFQGVSSDLVPSRIFHDPSDWDRAPVKVVLLTESAPRNLLVRHRLPTPLRDSYTSPRFLRRRFGIHNGGPRAVTLVTERGQSQELPQRSSGKMKTEIELQLLRAEVAKTLNREVQVSESRMGVHRGWTPTQVNMCTRSLVVSLLAGASLCGLLTAMLPAITGASLVAQTIPVAPDEHAIIVLHDVSGSLPSRPAGWYEAFRRAAIGLVAGDRTWLDQWTPVGASRNLLDSIATALPATIGVSRFGTASVQLPYFSIDMQPSTDRGARADFVERMFPSRDAYREGKTYVDLAKAYTASRLADLGYQVVYLLVLSDFQNDADYTREQSSLINRYETQSLALKHGTPLVLEFKGNTPIRIEILRLASAAPRTPEPTPLGSVTLLRPGSTTPAGPVLFEWRTFSGAATYELVIRAARLGMSAPPPITLSGTSREIPRLSAGRYSWSVTAKGASQSPIARGERSLTVQGGGVVGTILLLVLVFGGVTAGVVWYIRRRRQAAVGGA